MNTTVRGLFVLIGLVAFVAVFCLWIPFILLPGAGLSVAMPVIYVPGEPLVKDFLGKGVPLTNTLVGMLLADGVIVVILIALYLRGGVKAVPGRLQSVLELFVNFMYNFAKSVAGSRAGRVFPLVMTIFFFLLIANWLELVPGVDSVGLLHCAEPGFNGYPLNVAEGEPIEGVVTLRNANPFEAGTRATEASFCACEALRLGHFPEGEEAQCVTALAEAGVAVPEDDLRQAETILAAESPAGEETAGEGEGLHDISAELSAAIGAANRQYGAYTAARQAADQAAADHAENAAGLQAEADRLADGAVNADLFVVTPFVRAAATDLNLTIALALIAVIMVQVYGVWALGPDYFQKFLNLRALGGIDKKPLGLIDFVVGLFELVSEFAKIISFAFRLFGNIFAGQVLLFIMAFLLAIFVPAVFYGLEMFVGLMQAFVFAVLTLVFSAQAMSSHHGGDHDKSH